MRLITELRRRRMLRTVALYIVAAWVVLQVAAMVFPALGIPDAAIRFVWVGVILGFPVALVFAWRYQITESGIERTRPLAEGDAVVDIGLKPADFILLSMLAAVLLIIALGVVREIREAEVLPVSVLGREIPANSIAVLPLDNLTGDPEQQYFTVALQEALISDLAVVSGLRVTSRTSSSRYANSGKSILEIGAELGVAYVIEGTVQRLGDRVRVRLQLINAALDELLWSENYEREVRDVLVLQGEVARTVAGEVGATLTPDERSRLTRTRAVNPEVYELVVKGLYFVKQFDPAAIEHGFELLNEAITLDPREPLAYAGLALGYNTIGHGINAHGAFPQARAAAEKALELDQYSGEAWAALAEATMYYDWDWDAAYEMMQKALQLSPSLDQMHAHFAYLLLLDGRIDEAIDYAERARDLSPIDPLWAGFGAWIYMLEARWEEGQRGIDECLAYTPGAGFCLYTAAQMLTARGRFDEAVAVLETGNPQDLFVVWAKGPTLALAGRDDEARAIAAQLDAMATPRNLMHLSFIYSALGEMDTAFDYLEQALAARTDWLPWIVFDNAYGGVIEPMRGHPRYDAVVGAFDLPMYRE